MFPVPAMSYELDVIDTAAIKDDAQQINDDPVKVWNQSSVDKVVVDINNLTEDKDLFQSTITVTFLLIKNTGERVYVSRTKFLDEPREYSDKTIPQNVINSAVTELTSSVNLEYKI